MPKTCHNCKSEWSSKFSPGFREECMSCGHPLHCCGNCRFYDQQAYQWCTEPMARAERPRDPQASNVCDYFVFVEHESPTIATGRQAQAKNDLDQLFGKKQDKTKPATNADDKPDWMRFDKPPKPAI